MSKTERNACYSLQLHKSFKMLSDSISKGLIFQILLRAWHDPCSVAMLHMHVYFTHYESAFLNLTPCIASLTSPLSICFLWPCVTVYNTVVSKGQDHTVNDDKESGHFILFKTHSFVGFDKTIQDHAVEKEH